MLEPEMGVVRRSYPMPTRHGMTAGELAQMFNKSFGIQL